MIHGQGVDEQIDVVQNETQQRRKGRRHPREGDPTRTVAIRIEWCKWCKWVDVVDDEAPERRKSCEEHVRTVAGKME